MRLKVVDYSIDYMDNNPELSRRIVVSKKVSNVDQAYVLPTGELEVICYCLHETPPPVPDVGEPLKETIVLEPGDWTIEEYNSFGQLVRVLTADHFTLI